MWFSLLYWLIVLYSFGQYQFHRVHQLESGMAKYGQTGQGSESVYALKSLCQCVFSFLYWLKD